jgi:DNA repair protein RadC
MEHAPGSLGIGPHSKSDGELEQLVAQLLGTPLRTRAKARVLLERYELGALSRLDAAQLAHEFDLPPAKARALADAFELGRRVEAARAPVRPLLRSALRVHELFAPDLRGLERETFHALLLDGKHRLRRRLRVSEGTLTSSLVHPREVFAPAVREAAAAVIVVHNHPSGDPEPSAEDLAVTRRLLEAGRLLGIPLIDHVVVADGGFVSLRERISFDGPA